eukprot:TRINITY_DN4995_c0_g1_i1.p1 TRINITY_DN4995_c0_g1~~TRINITY_DN4995_c0_g1_i1.p1  ORF type:complete len:290 (-),score=-4.37 TRINITY_DN4995_c0_g1_i1:115-984(-)
MAASSSSHLKETEEQQARDYTDPEPVPLLDVGELRKWSFYRAAIAELIATLIFLYIPLSTIIGNNKNNQTSCGGVGNLGIAWAFGGTIFFLVYCISGISGGHINPAVTFAMMLARRVSAIRALIYTVAQCLGALLGSLLAKGVEGNLFSSVSGGANVVASGYSKSRAFVAEMMGTFVLVYTVLSATDPKRNARDSHVPILAPLPIGFAVFMVHLATIPITGTGINPARSFGPAIAYNGSRGWHDHWIFWVGPLVGSALAVAYHQYVVRAGRFRSAGGAARSLPNIGATL